MGRGKIRGKKGTDEQSSLIFKAAFFSRYIYGESSERTKKNRLGGRGNVRLLLHNANEIRGGGKAQGKTSRHGPQGGE